MPTPEELAAQEAQKALGGTPSPTPPPAPPAGPVVLQGEHIPEAFRGKTDKEIVELLLNTSTELEKQKETVRQKELEVESLRPKPQIDQLSDADKKALREKEFISDPVTYLDKQDEERMKPLRDQYYQGQAEVNFQLIKADKSKYPDFEPLEKPIRDYLNQMPPDVRANPTAIDWAYKMARYPELEKRIKEGSAREGLHTQGGGNPPPAAPSKRELDDEEKIVAARFGLSPEEYVKFSNKGSVDEL